MRDIVIHSIEKGLLGSFTHRATYDIIDGLTHEQALLKASEGLFSSWEILYHIDYWQGLILESVRKDVMNWRKAIEKHWPRKEDMNDNRWDDVVQRFKDGIADATALLKEVDLEAPMKTLRDEPTLRAFMILAQHNSYHLGQIVVNRKENGLWPFED
jgi:uncharacterized damage-inducible protein DinB